MKREFVIFCLAVQFLTRIPIPAQVEYTPSRFTASVRYYPLVGALVGAICALIYWLSHQVFPSPLAIIIAVASGMLITGAFHEDGLADTFDGIGGGMSRDRALEIMRDSRLGTYGSMALIMAILIKLASLILLPDLWVIVSLTAAHSVSRLSSVLVIATSTYARSDGKAKPVAQGVSATGLTVALLTGIAALVGVALVLPLTAMLAGLTGLVVGHMGMRLMYDRKLGGYTGDTLGAVQQASEIGFYLGLVAWL